MLIIITAVDSTYSFLHAGFSIPSFQPAWGNQLSLGPSVSSCEFEGLVTLRSL